MNLTNDKLQFTVGARQILNMDGFKIFIKIVEKTWKIWYKTYKLYKSIMNNLFSEYQKFKLK